MRVNGEPVTDARTVQEEQKSITEAKRGMRVAVSYPDVTIGRNLKEGEILYSAITEKEFRQYKDNKEGLTTEEKDLLKEIANIMRVKNAVWGI